MKGVFFMQKNFMIGISSRALFDLEEENAIFESQGVEAYVDYQIAHEKEVLAPGAAFSLIQAFLALNRERDSRQIEVVIMSKNSADAALRIFHSIEYYGLDITRAALTGGGAIAPYLRAYGVDLYLSFNAEEVKNALQSGIAAGVLLPRGAMENGGHAVSTRTFPGTYRQAYPGKQSVRFKNREWRLFVHRKENWQMSRCVRDLLPMFCS